MGKNGFQGEMGRRSIGSLNRLENIEEENPTNWFPTLLPPPETPTESMEFLGRSWSLSSLEISKALRDAFIQSHAMETATCSLDAEVAINTSATTNSFQHSHEVPTHSTCSPPNHTSTKETQDIKVCKGMEKGKSMSRWLKDTKHKKKEEIRALNAQLHAATSVAGVAAAVAAIVAATATSSPTSEEEPSNSKKSSVAVASAAALVASHCVEIAEEMGADRDQILTAINSAINVKTTGDIMTLTAGAATALRGAAALRARLFQKEIPPPSMFLDARAPEDNMQGQQTFSALNFVTRGGELLKRTRKGDLHWKQVSLHINSNGQVVVKMESKHIAGTFLKKKKSVVVDLCCDVPAWDGSDGEEGGQQRAYFGIITAERLTEFECKDKNSKQMWVDGIQHMLQYRGNVNNSLSL